jgi:Immunoglobulin-like domain of bacterial spore germination/Sporulation and spore germination
VAQVTYTLTQLPDVDEVWFRIDGEPRDMLTGEGVMVDPATRDRFQDGLLPGILLEQPFDQGPVTDPIVIGGMTNAFEATVNYRVLDVSGAVVVEGMTTALCGTGCWGGFSTEIDLPDGTRGPLTLQVFDYSEEDGTSMLDLVEITLV